MSCQITSNLVDSKIRHRQFCLLVWDEDRKEPGGRGKISQAALFDWNYSCSLFRSPLWLYASKKKRGKRRAKLQTTATIWFPHILPFPAMISLLVCTHFWCFSHCGCFGGRYHLNILQKLWANVDYKWSEDVKQLISNQKFEFLKFWHLFLGSAQHNQFWRW